MPRKKSKTRFDLLALADYEKIAQISEITVSDGTILRILQSSAETKNKVDYTLVLVAGWSSLVLSWDKLLMVAKNNFDILYIETREKGTSKINKNAEFDIERFTLDIQEIIEQLNIKQEKMIMLTSSFSAMLVSYMLKNNMITPYLTIFIGPIESVPIPKSIKILVAILPKWLSVLVKPIGIWWVKTFKAEDEEHGAKYARSIREADPTKWNKTAKNLSNKLFWDVYKDYDDRVLIVDESEDKMHDTNMTHEIAKLIKNHDYIDLKTNKDTHSKPMVTAILEYLEKIK